MARSAADRRRRAEWRGRLAEAVAALWLAAKGYRIVARRFRAGVGEVDIVVRRGRTLAFVEVKLRASLDAGLEAVGPRSRARIVDAARAWSVRFPNDAGLDMRFDVMVIAPWRLPRHVVNAFAAE